MTRRLGAILLLVIFAVGLVACDGGTGAPTGGDAKKQIDTTAKQKGPVPTSSASGGPAAQAD